MKHGIYPKSRNASFPSLLSKTSAFLNTDFVSIMQKWKRNTQGGHRAPRSLPSSGAVPGSSLLAGGVGRDR